MAGLIATGCGDRPAETAPETAEAASPTRSDVLVVTIDTARADHFSYTGAARAETPAVDRLAAEGTAFLTAVSPAPITLPAHASLFTGLLPPAHGVRNNGTYRLAPEMTTLAEVLAAEGYETAAFVAAAVLDRRYGLDQGFGHYDDRVGPTGNAGLFQYPRRPGEEVIAAALRWLDRQPGDRPTLVWVHLFDPHAPYEPPEPERSRYPDSPYAATIAYADRVVGTLLDGYRQRQRYRRAVIALTSDHGESLGEHGESTHGIFLYDATVKVPLVLRGPGIEAGRRVNEQVRLVDLFPTLLRLVGVPPAGEIDGRDLRPLLAGEASGWPSPSAYSESRLPREQYGWADLAAVRTTEWKLIVGATEELYDLGADPRESEDLAARLPERVAALRRMLPPESGGPVSSAGRIELDEAARAQLGALGYLATAAAPAAAPRQQLPDPRERIVARQRMLAAVDRFTRGDRDGAIAAYREIVAEEPGNFLARAQLGDLLSISGRYREALEVYRQAGELMPQRADVHHSLGRCLEILGRPGEALDAFERALAADPRYRPARERRWRLLLTLDQAGTVEDEARQALIADRGDADAYLALALAVETDGGAAAVLDQGLERAGRDGDLVAALARIRIAEGRVEEGLGLYREVLAREPAHAQAAGGLGHVLLARNQVAEASEVLARALDPVLPDPQLAILLAEARARSGEIEAALELAERAAAALPDDVRAWTTLGSVRRMAGRLEDAAAAYRHALDLAPEDRTAALNLAAVYQELGDSERARLLRP